MAGERTISPISASVSGGADDESCGSSLDMASTTSAVASVAISIVVSAMPGTVVGRRVGDGGPERQLSEAGHAEP